MAKLTKIAKAHQGFLFAIFEASWSSRFDRNVTHEMNTKGTPRIHREHRVIVAIVL
jgi:hypothetical protein